MISAQSSVQREQGKDALLARRAVSSQAGPFKDNITAATPFTSNFWVTFIMWPSPTSAPESADKTLPGPTSFPVHFLHMLVGCIKGTWRSPYNQRLTLLCCLFIRVRVLMCNRCFWGQRGALLLLRMQKERGSGLGCRLQWCVQEDVRFPGRITVLACAWQEQLLVPYHVTVSHTR